jgi:hypothetical protein
MTFFMPAMDLNYVRKLNNCIRYRKTSVIVSPSVGMLHFDFSIPYENHADFKKIKNYGSIGDGVGLVSLRLAYGFRL